MYVFQLFDYYAGSRIVVLVALFEIIAVCYIYGKLRVDNSGFLVCHEDTEQLPSAKEAASI